ncbi:MAG TPA: 6-carboxytetrahydropterin synthase [Edaphocola sp.]|nr:6-carboxytetrahydropterin synthase [Edaphocola sp.]
MIYLTRVEHFNAAHKLSNPEWDDEKNLKVFGKCSNPNWHGHNYKLHVTVKGNPNPETGFVINAKILSDFIEKYVLDKVDHKNLNLEVDFMKGKHTTCENLAIAIWNELKPHVENEGGQMHCVQLFETENIYVNYYGEE